jgi:hypothetical protein
MASHSNDFTANPTTANTSHSTNSPTMIATLITFLCGRGGRERMPLFIPT